MSAEHLAVADEPIHLLVGTGPFEVRCGSAARVAHVTVLGDRVTCQACVQAEAAFLSLVLARLREREVRRGQ